MLSPKSWVSAVLMGGVLLCSFPLSAALRSRTNSIHAKPHGTLHLSRAARATRSTHVKRSAYSRKVASKPRSHGQQAIDPVRTLEIQQALIHAHYLSGEPTGQWDQATRDALVRLQDDNHWQTKIVPDSRALIKLGLGPSQQNLLNPDSAALAVATPGPEPDAAGAN